MGFLRRLLGGNPEDEQSVQRADTGQQPAAEHRAATPRSAPTPGQMLDYLEQDRANAEAILLDHFRECPECDSDYLRLGAWTRHGEAGWTVTCANCGHVLERTLEITAE